MPTNSKRRQRSDTDEAAKALSSGHSNVANSARQPTSQAVFRNFSASDFCPTESWYSLAEILKSNGGCYGLYGPRGSGKSWLMHMAVEDVEKRRGIGLWFPCPSKYNATDFLSTLSDNLANAIERRFAKAELITAGLNRVRIFLAIIVAVAAVLALTLYGVRGFVMRRSLPKDNSEFIRLFPIWVWILIAVAAFLAIAASIVINIYKMTAQRALLREATSLRERIRFTESLKHGLGVGLSGGKGLAASISRKRERMLSERPTSVASLVFDFRNLAEHVVSGLKRPLVICIDELDKIEDTSEVRALLRDIKGIFEVPGVHFLVSISEEAATSLQLGMLRSGGRDELNSSFYSVVSLPPLSPDEAEQLLEKRGLGQATLRLTCALCLLSSGNRRELIRMADICARYSQRHQAPLDERTIVGLLAEESLALLQEVTKQLPQAALAASEDDVKYRAWMALPGDAFGAADKFARLGNSAIREHWEPPWVNEAWAEVRESWRRMLIRLFIAAKVLPPVNNPSAACLLDDQSAVVSLRDISVMAMRDSGVARLMLFSRFGSDLSERFRPPQPRSGR